MNPYREAANDALKSEPEYFRGHTIDELARIAQARCEHLHSSDPERYPMLGHIDEYELAYIELASGGGR